LPHLPEAFVARAAGRSSEACIRMLAAQRRVDTALAMRSIPAARVPIEVAIDSRK
jgi:hypothetical protein